VFHVDVRVLVATMGVRVPLSRKGISSNTLLPICGKVMSKNDSKSQVSNPSFVFVLIWEDARVRFPDRRELNLVVLV
jgi:hypothetical protein